MKKYLSVFVFSFFLLSSIAVKAQHVIYVTETGKDSFNGKSWNNAIPGILLQDSINATALKYDPNNPATKTEFWIAQGAYKPMINPALNSNDNRDKTFLLRNGVALYGGFTGTETLLSERNIANNPTILSGDLGIQGDNTDNAYHVIVSVDNDATAILDGFIVEKGNASGGTPTTIANKNIQRSISGGMYILTSSPTIINNTFSENFAGIGGGAIFNNTSSLTITNCAFINNIAFNNGGAISNNTSSLTFTNCTFNKNTAGNNGGAILLYHAASVSINHCIFTENSADDVGGAIISDNSSPVITNSIFNGNTGGIYGGAIYANASSLTIINNLFSKNTAAYNGGAIFDVTSPLTIINNTFNKNIAHDAGGAIYNNYTTYGNFVSTISNSIFYNNTGGEIINEKANNSGTMTVIISNSLIQGGYSGTGNINADPLFLDFANPAGADGLFGTNDDGLRLQIGSPAMDAGNNAGINPNNKDLAGNARIQNGIVDMGAYEGFFTPLPLKLISFEGKVASNQIQLSWKTASEENTSHFAIEHSTNGIFYTIGTLTAAGNSSTIKSYTFTHQTPASGTNYYRLKMLDKDGNFTYSNVATVNVSLQQNELKIYPNPASGEVWVQHPASSNFTQLKIINIAGKLLKTIPVSNNVLRTNVNLNGITSGIYNIIWSDGRKTQNHTLFVE